MPAPKLQSQVHVLFSAGEISERLGYLADEITRDMGQDVMLVGILKGSFVFAADLARALHHSGMQPRIDFMTLSSYGEGTESSGNVVVTRDIIDDVQGAKVLIIDDILESGRTLAFAKELLLERGAQMVKLCVLLDKKGKRKTQIDADYVGFVCPDKFVVGYGLDYAHYFRELPFIGHIGQ